MQLTHDQRPWVQTAGVGITEAVVDAGGVEAAMILLPEIMPLLAEALAAADPAVERAAYALRTKLEQLTGEDLGEYL